MKKIISLLLATMLCLGCFSALAEDVDLTGVEIAPLEVKEALDSGISFRNANMAANSTAHNVTVTDNAVTVVADGVKIVFNIQKAGGGYMCFTQDLMASLASYLRIDDMEGLQKYLIDEKIYIYFIDEWTYNENFIYNDGEPDQLSALIGDLATQSASIVNQIATSMGGNVIKYNGRPWIYAAGSDYVLFITIAGGQYIYVQAAGTLDDAAYIMNALSVTTAK